MWEGEPVGVDQKRPLVGFALVAVLCAVLMTLSVGQGWGMDLFRPGKPIAAPAELRHRAPVHADKAQPVAHETVTIPAELSAQPLGVATPQPVSTRVARATAQSPAPAAAPQADHAAQRAERKAEKALAKLQRKADKAATKAERKAAKTAATAERDAEKAAAAAARDAEKAAAAAARDAAKLARQEVNAAR
jgi:hypothetical protein